MEAKVDPLVFGDLAALTSTVPRGEVRARRRDVLAHSRVLQTALGDGPVLPMRFGTVFDGEDAVISELLRPRQSELVRLLLKLDGQVEMNVRATYDKERLLEEIVRESGRVARLREATRGRPEAATRGLLLELGEAVAAEIGARRDRDAKVVVDRLASLSKRVHVDEPWTEYEVLRASFLVDGARLEAFERVLEVLARDGAGLMRFKSVGPLAPHSFVALGGQ
jgi:hypothetical protein